MNCSLSAKSTSTLVDIVFHWSWQYSLPVLQSEMKENYRLFCNPLWRLSVSTEGIRVQGLFHYRQNVSIAETWILNCMVYICDNDL